MRCSPRATTRRSTTASSCAGPAPARSARTAAWPRSATWRSDPRRTGRRSGRRRAAGTVTRARHPRRLRRASSRSLVDLPASARSRSSSTPATAWAATPCRPSSAPAPGSTALPLDDRPAVLRARRHVPEPRGQPARAGEPARPAGGGRRARRRHRSRLRRRRRPLLRRRRARRAGEPERDHRPGRDPRDRQGSGAGTPVEDVADRPQRHHVARRPGGDRRERARGRSAPASGHSFIKAEMARHDAVFGGEHSAHYYFRDFWFADTGMLAALHVLAALGEQTGPLSELGAAYERYVASGEINSRVDDVAAATGRVRRVGVRARVPVDGRRAGRPHGDPPGHDADVVVQPARVQHRTAAAAQRRGRRPRDDGERARRGARAHPGDDGRSGLMTETTPRIEPWLREILRCPVCRGELADAVGRSTPSCSARRVVRSAPTGSTTGCRSCSSTRPAHPRLTAGERTPCPTSTRASSTTSRRWRPRLPPDPARPRDRRRAGAARGRPGGGRRFERLTGGERPRSVLVAALGGSAVVADVLELLAEPRLAGTGPDPAQRCRCRAGSVRSTSSSRCRSRAAPRVRSPWPPRPPVAAPPC